MGETAAGGELTDFSTGYRGFQQLQRRRGIANIHLVAAVRKTAPGRQHAVEANDGTLPVKSDASQLQRDKSPAILSFGRKALEDASGSEMKLKAR